jgi:hypothetical protein
VCSVRDEELLRLRKFRKIDALFDRHKLNLAAFKEALPEHGYHNEHKNSFWLCLKRFVGIYFRA